MKFNCSYERFAGMRYDFDIYSESYESAHRQARVVIFNMQNTHSAEIHRRVTSLRVTPVPCALSIGRIAMELAYRG